MADAGRDDWLLCQITSNPYNEPSVIRFTGVELTQGTLNAMSFARPLKLFTANKSLMVKRIARLNDEAFKTILTATIEALRKNLPK